MVAFLIRGVASALLMITAACTATVAARRISAAENFENCVKAPHDVTVRLETERGMIDVALYGMRAPITVCNFLGYVQSGILEGATFFRTVRPDNQVGQPVKISVIQADIRNPERRAFAPIPIERTAHTGIHHVDGTISMARDGPDTASSSFFITIGDQPELDFGGKRNPDGQGFAAFGHVTRGMDVVRRIWNGSASGETLTPPSPIKRAYLLENRSGAPQSVIARPGILAAAS